MAIDGITSYHLGLIIDDLAAEVAIRREAPAGPNLRAACVDRLPWDQRFRTCWDDPAFSAFYARLRAELNLDASPTIVTVLPVLRAWLLELDPPAPIDPEEPF